MPNHTQWQSLRGKRSGAKTRGNMDVALDFFFAIVYHTNTIGILGNSSPAEM
ncbi:MAG: hypothetical protein Ta2A_17300 [Treponemataceae bacterium]|nr:MAG: hypothetical protein Ta2A_17300 [Treponemataceae bacterium]